jgi:pimeloyl-ACP methyl ester carboxylesterase
MRRGPLLGACLGACVIVAAGCGTAPRSHVAASSLRAVEVRGYSITAKCTGSNRGKSPTVVLIPGLATPLTTFSFIQTRLSSATRVCSYDPPGEGTSSKPRTTLTLADSAAILQQLLLKLSASAHGVVLVGHSIGGPVAATYASRYRAGGEVKALVLLDATPPSLIPKTEQLISPDARGPAAEFRRGIISLVAGNNPLRLAVSGAPLPSIGNVPLIVVQHGQPIFSAIPKYTRRLELLWANGQRQWLRLSTRSRMVIARDSGHLIYRDQPSLTVRLIRQAIAEAESGS